MESASHAGKNIFRRALKRAAKEGKSWLLKLLRDIIWRADEWVQRQEVRLRDEAAAVEVSAAALAEVDPVASAAREHAHKRAARAARPRSNRTASSARPRLPRLKYEHGEFVRRNA